MESSHRMNDSNIKDRLLLKDARAWLRRRPGWQQFLITLTIAFVVVALVFTVAGRANAINGGTDPGDFASYGDGTTDASFSAGDPNADVVGSQPPGMQRPGDPETFISNFKAGRYGHARPSVSYSGAFHDWWIAEQNRYYDNHPKYVPCPGVGNFGCTWSNFQNHDTCIVGALPDTFTTNSCTFKGSTVDWAAQVASPYWTKRGDLQNKWTARIVFCGTVGFVVFGTGGTAAAALGSGAGACLGSYVVP